MNAIHEAKRLWILVGGAWRARFPRFPGHTPEPRTPEQEARVRAAVAESVDQNAELLRRLAGE